MVGETSGIFFRTAELPGESVRGDIAMAAGVVFTQREIETFGEQMSAIHDMETNTGPLDQTIRIV